MTIIWDYNTCKLKRNKEKYNDGNDINNPTFNRFEKRVLMKTLVIYVETSRGYSKINNIFIYVSTQF